MLINATATIATARGNKSVLRNCNLSAFASNCDNLRETHLIFVAVINVYKRSRPSAVMDSVHDPEKHNLKWTHSRMDTIPNGHIPDWTQSQMDTFPNGHDPEWTRFQMSKHLHLYSYFGGI